MKQKWKRGGEDISIFIIGQKNLHVQGLFTGAFINTNLHIFKDNPKILFILLEGNGNTGY
jgi:hypothetical protein